MDLICGENTCQNFREKWLSWAPKVVDYALGLPKSKKNPWTVLGHYNGQLDDFGKLINFLRDEKGLTPFPCLFDRIKVFGSIRAFASFDAVQKENFGCFQIHL